MVVVARVAAVLLWLLSLAAGGEEEDHAAGSDRTSCAAADATAVLQEDADWFRVEVGAYFTDDLGGGGSGGGRNSSASSSARLVVSHDPHVSSAAGTVQRPSEKGDPLPFPSLPYLAGAPGAPEALCPAL